MPDPAFVSGVELCRQFQHDVVRPFLAARYPDLPYASALLGRGSEVLGFDDAMSRDHNVEARVLLFLRDADLARFGAELRTAVQEAIPERFGDRPTAVEVHSPRGFVRTLLGFDLDEPLDARDWLTFSEPRLCMLVGGAVFHDEIGLRTVRELFAAYPHDVWLYLLASAWWRVHPEANLIGRTGYVGDELGSALIGAELVRDLMHLCFLMERRYAPYSKWFGTAFSRLACAGELEPVLRAVLRADGWRDRERWLNAAYEIVARMHDDLGITDPVQTSRHRLWDRPFEVLWGDFPGALHARIRDPQVQAIAERWPSGGIDRYREVLVGRPDRTRGKLRALLDPTRDETRGATG